MTETFFFSLKKSLGCFVLWKIYDEMVCRGSMFALLTSLTRERLLTLYHSCGKVFR